MSCGTLHSICDVCICFNPLTTEFFPPRQHIFMPPLSIPPPPPPPPPLVRLVGEARRNLTKFLSSALKVVPRPSEAFLVSFWTDEKPYKCIGSK